MLLITLLNKTKEKYDLHRKDKKSNGIYGKRAHGSQKDKSVLPYILHPWTVAMNMPDEKTTVAALLHDVM